MNALWEEDLSKVRPSERKVSALSVEQRKDLFEKTVVPLYGLKQEDRDYKVLERVCVDGIYGSQRDDWKVATDKVVRVYDQCGWTLPKQNP